MEKVRPWCGQPSDRGRLKNRTQVWAFSGRRIECRWTEVMLVLHMITGAVDAGSQQASQIAPLLQAGAVYLTGEPLLFLIYYFVMWNSAFRKIFNVYWYESVKPLHYYCSCLWHVSILLPMKKLLFWKKMLCCSNMILCRLAKCCDASICALAAKFHLEPHDVVRSSITCIKDSFWFYFSKLVTIICLQCFDAVGWAAGRASGL